jgi:hypothetical protein
MSIDNGSLLAEYDTLPADNGALSAEKGVCPDFCV